jgi:hypothetical protein
MRGLATVNTKLIASSAPRTAAAAGYSSTRRIAEIELGGSALAKDRTENLSHGKKKSKPYYAVASLLRVSAYAKSRILAWVNE